MNRFTSIVPTNKKVKNRSAGNKSLKQENSKLSWTKWRAL